MNKNEKLKHITKMPWGYWVRFYRKRKTIISQMFKFKDYSTNAECLLEAQKWRAKNKPLSTQLSKLKETPNKFNKLQIVGVCIESFPRKYKITQYARAFWGENGKTRSKRFSIDKYGKKEAIEMARIFRINKMKELNKKNNSTKK
ncbi:MAG: AP2 domain-containing protein [Candidatus Cloacimonetes bacterium]|nr:AP2 domain-containing protein [Candidatus Cloacimonadota bacterium]